jgi:hypothetical protein
MDDKLFQYLLSNQTAWGEYYKKNKKMAKRLKNREYMRQWVLRKNEQLSTTLHVG